MRAQSGSHAQRQRVSSMCGQGREEHSVTEGERGNRQNTMSQDVRADISEDEEPLPPMSPSLKRGWPRSQESRTDFS